MFAKVFGGIRRHHGGIRRHHGGIYELSTWCVASASDSMPLPAPGLRVGVHSDVQGFRTGEYIQWAHREETPESEFIEGPESSCSRTLVGRVSDEPISQSLHPDLDSRRTSETKVELKQDPHTSESFGSLQQNFPWEPIFCHVTPVSKFNASQRSRATRPTKAAARKVHHVMINLIINEMNDRVVLARRKNAYDRTTNLNMHMSMR
ncbi:hypothetical protein F5051DRAFT_504790 [Lentinula edodes]|nr:hypothetical protein F5051DRAFT_504790 [Lentinula edodes]